MENQVDWDNTPAPLHKVLAEEFTALGIPVQPGGGNEADGLRDVYAQLHNTGRRLSALCISGGGIRSATFALGAIQGLAEAGLLTQFDYLSTVSGGGYIGSWLTAWIKRAQGINNVIPRLTGTTETNDDPCDDAGAHPGTVQPDPIGHLRDYNNYLTPKMGLGSADTWSMIAIVLRNLLLNWLVFIPMLMLVVMMPRLLLAFLQVSPPSEGTFVTPYGQPHLWVLGVAAVLFVYSGYQKLLDLPSIGHVNATQNQFLLKCLAPLCLSGLLTMIGLWWGIGGPATQPTFWTITRFMLLLTSVCLALYLLRSLWRKELPVSGGWRALNFTLAVLLGGMASGAAIYLLGRDLLAAAIRDGNPTLYITFGPPLIMATMLIGDILLVGFGSRTLESEDLEWLARSSGFKLSSSMAWMILCGLTLIAPHYVFALGGWAQSALSSLGGVSGLITALAGNSARTVGKPDDKHSAGLASRAMELAAKVTLPLFVVSLIIALSIVLDVIVDQLNFAPFGYWQHTQILTNTPFLSLLGLTAAIALFCSVMGRFVDINKFSLHGMYRFRLIRAYLAASNPDLDNLRFTGFNDSDDLRMHEFRGQRPLHVVNTALNLASGSRLDWQQRKAASFTISPYHAGSADVGYRDASRYCGGIRLGTAMTISGAAASPNMGYHTSSLVAFTMMLFNARLGAWLGNPGVPGQKTWAFKGPRFAVAPMMSEALSRTNENGPYVYLSDGGHFENLALYEMIRRRCSPIVVLDSGCDRNYTYEDLGNALRKIRIDLKIPIEFSDTQLSPLIEKQRRCAVAAIRYSCVDAGARDGLLVYFKPMVRHTESPDVLSYSASSAAFPHESTSDQWFTEAQTESYRALGMQTIREAALGFPGGTLAEFADFLSGRRGAAA
ncbi:patatin-like phospholipase family protein [uncultured Paludibaculum sp.]|uniref:patatin-like phospholipase family protein n=1 Tax=uncultured Paludibaculum sp. TaxID=1765020 RepID=UPI002AAABC53|nr:patatin-like phospholipase family protein [uncultured Paludibaculum sp.]